MGSDGIASGTQPLRRDRRQRGRSRARLFCFMFGRRETSLPASKSRSQTMGVRWSEEFGVRG